MRLFPVSVVAIGLAALGWAGVAHAQMKEATTRADLARLEEAKKHMKAGAAFYNDPAGHKCEEALLEFGKAFDLSGSFNALRGMAVCNHELERDGAAIQQYAAYLQGKGAAIEPGEKAQVETDLNALKEAVATVTLSVDREGVQLVDVRTPAKGYPIRNSYALRVEGQKLGIHPGQHVFTASVEGQPELTWKVEITNGGAYEHLFDFSKPKVEVRALEPALTTRPVSVPVIVAGSVTAALVVPWVALMVRAKSQRDAYEKANHTETASQLAVLRDGVTSANHLADAFLGATAAGLVTTTVLFFARPTRTEPGSSPSKSAALIWAPAVGPSGAGAVLTGSF